MLNLIIPRTDSNKRRTNVKMKSMERVMAAMSPDDTKIRKFDSFNISFGCFIVQFYFKRHESVLKKNIATNQKNGTVSGFVTGFSLKL